MKKLVLQKLGIAGNEAKIYLTLLRSGVSSAGTITKKSGIHRSNVYDALERLKEKGLINFVMKNKRRHYEAVDPNKLMTILEEERAEIEQKEQLLNKILPELTKIKQQTQKDQAIQIFEGPEGIKNLFEDILQHAKVNKVIGGWSYPWILKHYLARWHARRVKKKVKDMILFKSSSSKRAKELAKMKYTDIRILPNEVDSPIALNIYADRVGIIIGLRTEPIGIIIKNKKVMQDYEGYFDLLWQRARKVT
ncbi:MAG: TrmB family transcriptional regulator [Nanoarchaeota archaeon]|nr:TrmB family transcriptional regulator [Nanoarchaeota archaeon]